MSPIAEKQFRVSAILSSRYNGRAGYGGSTTNNSVCKGGPILQTAGSLIYNNRISDLVDSRQQFMNIGGDGESVGGQSLDNHFPINLFSNRTFQMQDPSNIEIRNQNEGYSMPPLVQKEYKF